MEESAVPPPEPSPSSKPQAPWPKRHMLEIVGPFILVVIVVIVAVLLAGNNGGGNNSSGKPHLVVDNTGASQVQITDTDGKSLYSLSYPKFSYMNFEASSPKGEVLLSQGITTSSESFIFAVGGKTVNLPKAATKALHSAIVLDSSHQVYFTDENDVAYVTCPTGSTCKLMSVNLQSGKTATIVDTGAKPLIPQLPPVYPLGISPDGQTIYLRTLVSNKLGKTASAVYALNLDGKTTHSWAMAQSADYTPKLSPDAKQVAFKTTDGKTTDVGTLNLETGKTYSAKWSGGAIPDLTSVFNWSPDSKKVLFWGSDSILPRAKIDTAFDIDVAYLNSTDSQLTNLWTIKDSAHNQIGYQAWIDNKTIVYEQDGTNKAYDFSSPATQIFKHSINSQTATKLSGLSGNLKQVIFY